MKGIIALAMLALLTVPAFGLVNTGWNGTSYGGSDFKYWSEVVQSKGDVYLDGTYNTSRWQNVTVMRIDGPGAEECYFGFTAFGAGVYGTTPVHDSTQIAGRRGSDDCLMWVASNLGPINATFAESTTLDSANSRNVTVF